LWGRELNTSDIYKEIFLFTVGSVCRVKLSKTGSRNSFKDIRNSQIVPYQVRKWSRQQSKDFYAAGFDALVKRWDKCVSVGVGYVKKQMFFHVWIPHVLCFISICDLFTDSPSYIHDPSWTWTHSPRIRAVGEKHAQDTRPLWTVPKA
jgi:hypothetical protein